MIKHERNIEATQTACPVIPDVGVTAYLREGTVPAGAGYILVPPGKILRKRAFWLLPSYRAHPVASLFLISTDSFSMNEDTASVDRPAQFCYYSAKSKTCYLGSLEKVEGDNGALLLAPIIADQFPKLSIRELVYVGHVVASA